MSQFATYRRGRGHRLHSRDTRRADRPGPEPGRDARSRARLDPGRHDTLDGLSTRCAVNAPSMSGFTRPRFS